MARSEKEVRFVSCQVPSSILALMRHTEPETTEKMLLAFIELASEGVKVSFSWKEQQNAYNVSVTLPVVGKPDNLEVASFWDADLFYALFQAYVTVFLFKADRYGFAAASEAMREKERKLVAAFVSEKGHYPENE